LLLGEDYGWLEVVDIETSTITHTHLFTEGFIINDIIAIDEAHYLLGADLGLLFTTNDQVIDHYYEGDSVRSLSHITDLLYLVGLTEGGLIVWNLQTQ
jgi:hypothetical protein